MSKSWWDPFGISDVIIEFRVTLASMSSKIDYISGRQDEMSQVVDELVLQVTNTVGVVESATVALNGVIARLDALIAEEQSEGGDTAKLEALRTELVDATGPLAEAVAAVPPVDPVEPTPA